MSGGEDGSPNPGGQETLTLTREAPQLVAVLKEMKGALDVVRAKVETLTHKVRHSQLPTAEGMSYLEAKHLLLLNYCQCIVYYVLRKAKGLSIENHPLARSLVEIRLFLEKIRPIDKKLEYQIQKLTRAASNFVPEKASESNQKEKENLHAEQDPLKYRPNPDMLVPKVTAAVEDSKGVYRPPRFAPTTMEDDKISKQEKQTLRREKELLRQAKQSSFVKDIMDDLEGRPEEYTEAIGADTRELRRYKSKLDEQARQEEELFTRAPRTKRDKKIEKYMKTRNGLLGMTDGFFDEIKMLPMGEDENGEPSGHFGADKGRTGYKKRKRKH